MHGVFVVSPGVGAPEALTRTRECVVAVPGLDLLRTVVGVGNCSGAEVDK